MQKSTFCPGSLKMQSASLMNWSKKARGTWTTNLQLTICKRSWLCATRLYLPRMWPPCISFWTKVQPSLHARQQSQGSKTGSLCKFCPRNCSRAHKTFASKTCLLQVSPNRAWCNTGRIIRQVPTTCFARLKASELLRNCGGFMQGRHWQLVDL